MNEVATQTVALVLDSLEQRGLDATAIWAGLDIDHALLRRRGARINWDTWVAMLARIEQHSPLPLEDLFAPGAGARSGHPFIQIASGLVSLRDLYSLFARWGVRRSFTIARGSFEAIEGSRARFTTSFDTQRAGSLPTLRLLAGVLRHMPRLQGHAPAMVRMLDGATPHHAEYTLVLPAERPFVARARRVLRVFAGVAATLDELEAQANEIAAKNLELETQLAESRERELILDVALAAGNIGLWRWDPAIRRVRISPTLAAWLEVPGESEIDTTVWGRLVHPDDQAAISKIMATAFENRTPFDTEYRIEQTSGEVRPLGVPGHRHLARRSHRAHEHARPRLALHGDPQGRRGARRRAPRHRDTRRRAGDRQSRARDRRRADDP